MLAITSNINKSLRNLSPTSSIYKKVKSEKMMGVKKDIIWNIKVCFLFLHSLNWYTHMFISLQLIAPCAGIKNRPLVKLEEQ